MDGRKHHLTLEDESRRYFIVSSFGLLLGGSITIQVSDVRACACLCVGGCVAPFLSPSLPLSLSLPIYLSISRCADVPRLCPPPLHARFVWSQVALKKPAEAVGFTVHRDLEAAIEYTMDMQDTCIFAEDALIDANAMRFPFSMDADDQYTG